MKLPKVWDRASTWDTQILVAYPIPRLVPGVVLQQIVQRVLVERVLRGRRIRISSHLVKRQWSNGEGVCRVEVHVLHETIGIEKVVPLPTRRQSGQFRGIKIQQDLFTRSEYHELVVGGFEQRQHISVSGVRSDVPRIGTGEAHVFVCVI